MVFFIEILIENSVSKQLDADQVPHSAVSDQGLHHLPKSHKKDTRRIWVKMYSNAFVYECTRSDWTTSTLILCFYFR